MVGDYWSRYLLTIMADDSKKLASFTAKAFRGEKGGDFKVKQDAFVKFLADTAVSSPEDFYGMVSSKEDLADDQLLKLLNGCDQTKDDAIMWARAKTLWRTCKQYVVKQEAPVVTADVDAPLDAVDAAELEKRYLDDYKIPMHIMLTPEDRLKGRVYREFKSKLHTLVKVEKCRSLFMAHRPDASKVETITDALELRIKDGGVVLIRNHCDYFEGMRIRSNLYNWCGNWMTTAQDGMTHVKFSPPQVNNDYVDEAFRASNLLECDDDARLAWLRRNDQATMAAMISLMRRGWTQGEALTQAKLEKAVEWRVSKQAQMQEEDEEGETYKKFRRPRPPRQPYGGGKGDRESRKGGGKGKNKRVLQTNFIKTATHSKGKPICKGYNDGRCKVAEGQCPKKMVHVCDALIGGKVCGSKSHTREYHKKNL